ncbi:hypothetical protein Bbelb_316990 [Branchiostoma belcheri]|nr:hypothetical protein Bbelb_316990 [Branchiostoma belcheri]
MKIRPNQKGGGIAVYIPVDCQARRLHDLEDRDLEVIWVQFRPRRLPRSIPVIALGVIYHPPCKNNKQGFDEMLTHLVTRVDTILNHQPQAGILLCGDLNRLPLKCLQAAHPTLRKTVKQPTRGAAILDVVITNLAKHYNKPQIIPSVGSSDSPDCQRSSHRKREFVVALALQDWTAVFEAVSVSDKVAKFYASLTYLLDTYCPVKMTPVRTKDRGWFMERVKKAIHGELLIDVNEKKTSERQGRESETAKAGSYEERRGTAHPTHGN